MGTLIPLWIFLDTAILVAHIPLFSAGRLPSIDHNALLSLLSVLRFDFLDLGSEPLIHNGNQSDIDNLLIESDYSVAYRDFIIMVAMFLILLPLVLLALSKALAKAGAKSFRINLFCDLSIRLMIIIFVQSMFSSVTAFSGNGTLSKAGASIILAVIAIFTASLLWSIFYNRSNDGEALAELHDR